MTIIENGYLPRIWRDGLSNDATTTPPTIVKRGGPTCNAEGCDKPKLKGQGLCTEHRLQKIRSRPRKPCTSEGCDRPRLLTYAHCSLHRSRHIRFGDLAFGGDHDLRTRFWSRVDKDGPTPCHRPDLGPCWVWTGPVHKRTGYGITTLHHRPQTPHRLAWLATHGLVPEGLELDHFACDNRVCCNPAHLKPVTPLENTRRAHEVRRRRLSTVAVQGGGGAG